MKIIYEDGNDPQINEGASGGSFEIENVNIMGTGSKRNVPPNSSSDLFTKQSNEVPVQLTPEQITAILQQLLASQQAAAQKNAPVEKNVSEEPAEEKKAAPEQNPGTRVLYQSPDFDGTDDKDVSLKVGNNNPQANYSVREISEETVEEENFSQVRNYSGSFNVDDVEVEEEELQYSVYEESLPPQKESYSASLPLGDIEIEEVEDEDARAKKKKIRQIIRISVLSVSIIAIIISSAVLIREFKLHKENRKLESEVSELIIDEETDIPGVVSNNIVLTEEQQWEQIKSEYSGVVFPIGMQLKYAKLYATNPDFVGYLDIPELNLGLPVVQSDNDSEYLAKSFYGKSTKYGCPFVTYFNKINELDLNTVIYGHHMNDKTIFGALDAYKSIEGFKKAPVITFNTLYKDYKWKVVAAFITNSYPSDDNGYVFNYFFTALPSQLKFAAYINEMAQRSLYDTGVDVLPTDKLLTLSTCSHEFDNGRFVVVARLVRPGESENVNTSAAVVNSNPRYPQAYYSKKKISNPYADANRWEVG